MPQQIFHLVKKRSKKCICLHVDSPNSKSTKSMAEKNTEFGSLVDLCYFVYSCFSSPMSICNRTILEAFNVIASI